MRLTSASCIIVFTVVVLSSCYSPRYVYSPVTQNIPELQKKKDLIITPSYSAGIGGKDAYASGYNHGLDLDIAYAFSNHFAMMLNQYNRWEKNGGDNSFYYRDTSVLRYERSLTELGFGYYKNRNQDSSVYFQFFAGAAIGKSSIYDDVVLNGSIIKKYHKANVTRFFIQPSFTFGQNRKFSAALSSRFSAVKYSNIHSNYSSTELDNYFLDSLTTSAIYFWEPAFNFSFGHKKLPGLKLQMQLGNTVLLNRRFIDIRSINLSFGLVADMRKLFWKKRANANE